MADRKISDLTALTTPASGDYLPIVDISEAAAASKNKRVTIQSLFQGIPVNVGVGTGAPRGNVSIANNDSASGVVDSSLHFGYTLLDYYGHRIVNSNNPSAQSAGLLKFQRGTLTAWTDSVVIDNSGRLLVGTSSARTVSEVIGAITYAHQPNLQLEAGNNSLGISLITNRTGDSTGPFITLGKSRGGTLGSVTVVQNGDELGNIYFAGADGTDIECIGAAIFAEVDGTPGANDMPGRLVFSTTADGASSPTERMRIDSSGRLLVGTSTVLGGQTAAGLHITAGRGAMIQGTGGALEQACYVWNTATSGDNVFIEFGTETSISTRASIDYNRAAGQVRYNATSDQRLKSDIFDSASAINTIEQIKVRSYKWTETGYTVPYGFIAQELHEVAPDAVKVGDNSDEVVNAWAVDNAKLVPVLTKALQEALQKIEILEQRLSDAGIA